VSSDQRREKSRELQARLSRRPLSEIPGNQLGKATYAWLIETKAAQPYDSPDGAGQTYSIVRAGKTIGDLNILRLESFLDMLEEEDDPYATVQGWIHRNGGNPTDDDDDTPRVNIPDEVRELLGPIAERYEAAQTIVEQKQAELNEAREVRNTLLNILKAAGIVPRDKRAGHPGRRPKEAPTPKKNKNHVSDETALKVLEEIRAYFAEGGESALPDVAGSFTRPQIEKVTGRHHSQMSAAVEKLRDQGHVRAAGITKSPATGQKVNVYALEIR
jgi:hypothetical protein